MRNQTRKNRRNTQNNMKEFTIKGLLEEIQNRESTHILKEECKHLSFQKIIEASKSTRKTLEEQINDDYNARMSAPLSYEIKIFTPEQIKKWNIKPPLSFEERSAQFVNKVSKPFDPVKHAERIKRYKERFPDDY